MTRAEDVRREELERAAAAAIDGVRRRGIPDARAVAVRSRVVSVTYRLRRPEKVEESSRRGLTLYLYDGGRYTACETNDLRPEALERFLDSAAALTRATTPDPFREITDPRLYEGRADVDLGTFDPSVAALVPKDRHDLAAAAEDAVLAEAGDGAVAAEAGYEDEETELYQAHSNGFAASKRGTRLGLFAEVSLADDGDKRPSESEFASVRTRGALPDPRAIGRGAAQRARLRLKASPIETAVLPMVLENRAVGRLLGKLLAALGGRALQQQQSFLAGALGTAVGSPALDLVDDPFLAGGAASRTFDGEGIAAKRMPVFEKGVLATYYIDTYYAKKLGQRPTTGASSNLLLAPGALSLDEMVAQIPRGVLVRGFVGGNSNPTTGDFSFGVYGTLIESGRLSRAVAEMNVSGNHKDLWQRLVAAADDPWRYGSLRAPSLLIDGVQFSGGGEG
jgi:PmbA protein